MDNILPERLERLRSAIKQKDFSELAYIAMRDSNNFHAVCRDTFPSICYLNDTSNLIIKLVDLINKEEGKIICGYTFDAGPNAFLLVEEGNLNKILNYFQLVFTNLIKFKQDIIGK